MHRFPGQDTHKAPHDIACHVESLLDEQARMVDELMSAETAYIEAVAEAQRAGLLSRGELSEAYARLHSWGISNFSNRWRRLIGVVPEQLRAAPVTTPPGIESPPATRMPPVDTYGR